VYFFFMNGIGYDVDGFEVSNTVFSRKLPETSQHFLSFLCAPRVLLDSRMNGKLFLEIFTRTTDGTQRRSRSQSSADFQVCRVAAFQSRMAHDFTPPSRFVGASEGGTVAAATPQRVVNGARLRLRRLVLVSP